MMTLDEYSELLSAIYEAALDSQLWPEALRRLAMAVGANVFSLLITDGSRRGHVSFGLDPAASKLYDEYYWQHDPITAALPRIPTGSVRMLESVIPLSEFHRSEFHHDWSSRANGDDAVFAALLRNDMGVGTFFVAAGNTAFVSPQALELLQRVTPHLQRAVQSWLLIGDLNMERAAALDALDRLQHGVFLLNDRGVVLFHNRAAAGLQARGDGIASGTARLSARLPREDMTLQRLIAGATGSKHAGVRGGGSMTLSRPDCSKHLIVHVLPWRTTLGVLLVRSSGALVLVVDPDQAQRTRTAELQQLYGLTRAEAVVATYIGRGQGLQSVADELHVTLSTVRIHLQRVFEKTNTHRQAQLVRLLFELWAGLNLDEASAALDASPSSEIVCSYDDKVADAR